MPRGASRLMVLCLFGPALFAGCKTLGLPKTPGDLTPARETRRAEAVARFEKQRDAAEYQAAEAAWDRGDSKGCREALEHLVNRRPDHRDARFMLAAVLLEQRQPDVALTHLEAILKDHPDDAEVHHVMAVALTELGRNDEAREYREKAAKTLGKQSEEEALPAGYAEVVPAGFADRTGQDEWSNADPAKRAAAETLLRQAENALAGGEPERAWGLLQSAASQNPDDPQIPTAATVILVRHNRPDLAVQYAQAAVTRFPRSASLHRGLATAYYRRGEYQSSQLVLQQALSLDKSNGLAYFLMGCTLTKLGQATQAETFFRQAELLDPMFAAQRPVSPLR